MMYLSCLLIDVGMNPDRPRPARLWLRNLYRVHQRLCMAFPSAARARDDAQFLRPFESADFGCGHVKVQRAAHAGFLFRIDPQRAGRVMILVQSAVRPDWEYAFRNAGHFLAAPPETKAFDRTFSNGERLRFRLAANPTKRLSRNSRERDGQPVAETSVGKRVPVSTDDLRGWLARKAATCGFSVIEDSVTIQSGYVYCEMPRKQEDTESGDKDSEEQNGKAKRLRSVRYDGILEVTDADAFRETLARGIGPGKAFGFGLLSVAPA